MAGRRFARVNPARTAAVASGATRRGEIEDESHHSGPA